MVFLMSFRFLALSSILKLVLSSLLKGMLVSQPSSMSTLQHLGFQTPQSLRTSVSIIWNVFAFSHNLLLRELILVNSKILWDLESMKSIYDQDSITSTQLLDRLWTRYSILIEFELQVPWPDHCLCDLIFRFLYLSFNTLEWYLAFLFM